MSQMSRPFTALLTGLAVFGLIGCTSKSGDTSRPPTPVATAAQQETLIAFESRRDGPAQIYVMKPDGSGQRRVTNTTSNNQVPIWSPDGRHLAYNTDRDDNIEIYVMTQMGQ